MFSFSLLDYGKMINDTIRMRAYAEALRRCVNSESVVLDIGTGTGIFALLACKLGARRVYAIDPNPWVELGEKMAVANGFADRIVFIRDLSTNVMLPEPVDVIISELRGRQPLAAGNISALSDARHRFLKPDGVMIPQRDVVHVSLVSAPELYREKVLEPWAENAFQLDLSAALSYARNAPLKLKASELAQVSQPLFPPQVWAEIDYRTLDDPNAQAHIEWEAERASTAHFIMTWFDTYLFDEVGYTTAPWKEHASLYSYDVFAFHQPLEIAPHDKITLDLDARFIHEGYIFNWNTAVRSAQGAIKADYNQSTFFSAILPNMFGKLASKRDPKAEK